MSEQPWRVAMAVLFLGALAAGLVLAVRSGDLPAPTTSPATGPRQPQSTIAVPVTTASVSPSVAVTTFPVTTVAPLVSIPPPDEVDRRDVLSAAHTALADWGEFAVTGDLSVVADTFDPTGPQYAQLAEEAPLLASDPVGPPPYVFTIGDVVLERPRPQRVVLVGAFVMSRPGEGDHLFTWRLHLRWSGSEWLLWTVESVEEG